jgi:hypothetical protein
MFAIGAAEPIPEAGRDAMIASAGRFDPCLGCRLYYAKRKSVKSYMRIKDVVQMATLGRIP